jgi:hypothetical protein
MARCLRKLLEGAAFPFPVRCSQSSQTASLQAQSQEGVECLRGSHRGTKTASRTGTPTVLTTTTDDKVFADDETRFLSIWVDESPAQTLAILQAQARGPKPVDERDLAVWQSAMALLKRREGDFQYPPAWLQYVAEQLPLTQVRARRDWERFLSFCQACALCRRGVDAVLDITFADCCVAYRILEPAPAAAVSDFSARRRNLTSAVARLNKHFGRAVTTHEIAAELGWKESLVYKHLKSSIKQRLVEYEPGTREKNEKRVRINRAASGGFWPKPWTVFRNNPEIGSEARYTDPFTGKKMVMRRHK